MIHPQRGMPSQDRGAGRDSGASASVPDPLAGGKNGVDDQAKQLASGCRVEQGMCKGASAVQKIAGSSDAQHPGNRASGVSQACAGATAGGGQLCGVWPRNCGQGFSTPAAPPP